MQHAAEVCDAINASVVVQNGDARWPFAVVTLTTFSPFHLNLLQVYVRNALKFHRFHVLTYKLVGTV